MIQKFIDAKKIDIKAVVDHAVLKAAGLARGGKDGVRLLAKGELTSKINLIVAGASKAAVEAVEKAGGKVEIIVKVSAAEKAAAKKSSAKNAVKAAAAKK
jgi:large subunit ribosomal protein L15